MQAALVSRAEIVRWLAHHAPDWTNPLHLERLTGGLLNDVWRVKFASRSAIWKYAPPFVASAPDIPLTSIRIFFEVQALQKLTDAKKIAFGVRLPRVLAFDAVSSVLLMEDMGIWPHLGEALDAGTATAEHGKQLGHWLGTLHRQTRHDPFWATQHRNQSIQQTRRLVQYAAIGSLLADFGHAEAEALGCIAEGLGDRFLGNGVCLTMGDLWPPSVLVREHGLAVIDWEFSHYGHPAQDVGHLLAHLWMQAHRLSGARREGVTVFKAAFLEGYAASVGDWWTPDMRRDTEIHLGAEILVRTIGAFRAGSGYENAPESRIREAVTFATNRIRFKINR